MNDQILFLHGWSSNGRTKAAFMRSLGYEVTTPRLSDWSFSSAVRSAQEAVEMLRPDLIVGASRGGAVAMNIDSDGTPLVLLAPAWKRWGKARTIHSNCVVIHSLFDKMVPFEDSVQLCGSSEAKLIAAGLDHRLNCEEGRRALARVLRFYLGQRHGK